MLRLTEMPEPPSVTLRAEGELVESWVELMAEECRRLRVGSTALSLDLSGVTYVDSRGVQCLRSLAADGITLVRCPPLIQLMLDGD
jgi:anti-anti-sigma regulatory factor